MKRLTVIAAALLCSAACWIAVAQTPLAFEVASIRQVDSSIPNIGVRGWSCRGSDSAMGHPLMVAATGMGRCRVMGMNVKTMIAALYSAGNISGGPGWIDSLPYTIEAKAEMETTTRSQLVQMMQTLMADRFKLSFHKDTKEVTGYAVVLGRDGHKLKEVAPDGPRSGTIVGQSSITGQMSVSSLASAVSTRLGVPVTDGTGLTGRYTVELKWVPSEIEIGGIVGAASDPAGGPSLFTALQEQLGLRLESRMTTVEVFVIDSIERPTEN